MDSSTPTRTSVITTVAFLGFVLLDVTVSARLVTGTWWLVLLLVWIMPWPALRIDDGRVSSRVMQLLALPVFAWLFFRAVNGLAGAVGAWEVPGSAGRFALLSFPMQDTLVGFVTAAMLVVPLRRTYGPHATAAALLVVLPYFMLAGLESVFVPERWAERPLANAIHLYEVVISPLVLLEACAILTRRGLPRARTAPGALRHALDPIQRGQLGAVRTMLLVFVPVAMLTAAAISLRVSVDRNPDAPLLLETLAAAMIPLVTVALTAAGIALLRALRGVDAPRGPARWLMRDVRATVFVLLGPLWLWTVLIDAPQTGAYAKSAVRSLPGSTWNIAYDAPTKTIRVAGEFQSGIARDFIRVLDEAPDAETVELQSPGGWVGEGIRIAEQIERRELSTRVTVQCSSACTLAFAAGARRLLASSGALGFHAGSAATGIGDGNREFNAYMLYRGVDPEFLLKSNAVPPKDIWVPDLETLRSAGIVTD
ncbi:MAG TPA: hypothetical protein VGA44_05375 [Steroidobacteraceae bacterium]